LLTAFVLALADVPPRSRRKRKPRASACGFRVFWAKEKRRAGWSRAA